MDSTAPQGTPAATARGRRPPRWTGIGLVGLAVIVVAIAAVAVASRTRTVSGRAIPALPGSALGEVSLNHVKTPLPQLLPDKSRFPAGYDVQVLPPDAAADAAGDLTGVGRHATVEPPGCRPPAQRFGPDDTAVEVGNDDASRGSVTVELVRVHEPLSARRDQLTRCATMTVTTYGAAATVTSRLQPPPASVAADDVIAVDQTIGSSGAGQTVRQSMTTLMAQVGDVRVVTTAMRFGPDPGSVIGGSGDDDSALLPLLNETIAKLRAG